ncbi:Protein polybromo-1 [Grifola frondosa]|uniref:Protein polybromo-1 n=1 Tax=Grifola frondosa TaxID=5627 RepID=A0A1C7MRW1_GRIFR|nr:Protein polybromo-1 [Grifola frondosa]
MANVFAPSGGKVAAGAARRDASYHSLCNYPSPLQPTQAMSKREASMFAAAGVDIDAPRAKRRKENPAPSASPVAAKEHVVIVDGDGVVKSEGVGAEAAREDSHTVQEKGLQLWHMVKDAVNKEGRILSHDFMRLPSKRQYPDYYQQIKRPIALDEIKAQLDAEAYASFEDVRQDFETCFRNAKRYNIKDSQIWKDAKQLHKLVIKEYSKMTGTKEDVLHDVADDGEEKVDNPAAGPTTGGSDDEGGGKKKKAPNLSRLLKSRLQKLIDKTDDEGRVLSTEFMELPSRKLWPSYYKIIKRPQCLENIFKHLKRKEYHMASDFANDVELVFSNALEFNQEHTGIWEDAVVLRDYFRHLMSDLPAPFAIPGYAIGGEHPTKIKLKMPATTSPAAPTSTPSMSAAALPPITPHSSAGLLLRVPAYHANGTTVHSPPTVDTKTSPSAQNTPLEPTPATATSIQPSASVSAVPNPVVPATSIHVAGTPKPTATGTLQPATFGQAPGYPAAYSQHYPNAAYQQPSIAPVAVTPSPRTGAVSQNAVAVQPPAAASTSKSPTPTALQSQRQLKYVSLTTRPLGRRFVLDHRDGVKTWAVRLCVRETSIHVADVRYQTSGDDGEEHGEESSDDEDKVMKEAERQEEEEEEEESPPAKPKPRGRGRPRKKAKLAESAKSSEIPKSKGKGKAPAKALPLDEVQVKLNGVLTRRKEDTKGEWDVDIPVGSSFLEVGEKGGLVWKVYLERAAF